MRNFTRGLLAAAAVATLVTAGCRGDANFADDANATRDQNPTTEGPAVVGKRIDPGALGTGGAGNCGDPEPCEHEPGAKGAAQTQRQ